MQFFTQTLPALAIKNNWFLVLLKRWFNNDSLAQTNPYLPSIFLKIGIWLRLFQIKKWANKMQKQVVNV